MGYVRRRNCRRYPVAPARHAGYDRLGARNAVRAFRQKGRHRRIQHRLCETVEARPCDDEGGGHAQNPCAGAARNVNRNVSPAVAAGPAERARIDAADAQI